MAEKTGDITAAIKAWEDCKASDAQLDVAIDAVEITLITLGACGANWVSTMGLQLSFQSMHSARDARRRDRKSLVAGGTAK